MDHVAVVVHEFEVVHQVRIFVVDQYHRPKVLIAMKIEHPRSYDEHHVVHIVVRFHQV